MKMKSVYYHRLSMVYNIQDFFYLPMTVTPEGCVWYRQRVGFPKVPLDATWLLPKANSL